MPISTPPTPPQLAVENETPLQQPPIDAGSSDGHSSAHGSPQSLASGLSSSSSEDAHLDATKKEDRRLSQSRYHDIDYLKVVADTNNLPGAKFKIMSGKEARDFVGSYTKCVYLFRCWGFI